MTGHAGHEMAIARHDHQSIQELAACQGASDSMDAIGRAVQI